MGRSTTALLRRIERETQERIANEFADRLEASRTGTRAKGLPRWAVDQMLAVGAIAPELHKAAERYASVIERSQEGAGPKHERVDGGDSDPHARAWNRSVSLQVARQVRSWVLARGRRRPSVARVLDRLFAFDGELVTGSRPCLNHMRLVGDNSRLSPRETERQIVQVLEMVDIALNIFDRGYGGEIAA